MRGEAGVRVVFSLGGRRFGGDVGKVWVWGRGVWSGVRNWESLVCRWN